MMSIRVIVPRGMAAKLLSQSPLKVVPLSCTRVSYFSTSPSCSLKMKEPFPPLESPASIEKVHPAWTHAPFTHQGMENVVISHRVPETTSDKVALAFMKLLRWGMDTATFYSHTPKDLEAAKRDRLFKMTERKWLVRMVFLESVAGVPGMVAGMVRHLHSLRRLRRDGGWIQTLLEEAYNERMHLLTFMKLAEPGIFMKTMILLTQGVFFNSLFVSYLISPRTVHRFVGYLEEEAVRTYTHCLEDIDRGLLPTWSAIKPDGTPQYTIPDIAVEYWNIPEGKRTMKELLLYIRADESKHREVNHTLGNLKPNDVNPYSVVWKDSVGKPNHSLDSPHPKGWEREEVMRE